MNFILIPLFSLLWVGLPLAVGTGCTALLLGKLSSDGLRSRLQLGALLGIPATTLMAICLGFGERMLVKEVLAVAIIPTLKLTMVGCFAAFAGSRGSHGPLRTTLTACVSVATLTALSAVLMLLSAPPQLCAL